MAFVAAAVAMFLATALVLVIWQLVAAASYDATKHTFVPVSRDEDADATSGRAMSRGGERR